MSNIYELGQCFGCENNIYYCWKIHFDSVVYLCGINLQRYSELLILM